MTVEEFEALTGRKLDGKYHKQETAEKTAETVDISEEKSIIESGTMLRKKDGTHRRIGSDGQQIIDKPTYDKLTKDFIKHDGVIISGEEAKRNLDFFQARVTYVSGANVIYLNNEATVSEVLEETYHAYQDRINMFGQTSEDGVILRREIDAQKHLLSLTDKYNIPKEEVELTEKNLKDYERALERFIQKGK